MSTVVGPNLIASLTDGLALMVLHAIIAARSLLIGAEPP